MAAAGVPIRTLQALMGHADIKTTMVYTRYAPAPNEVTLVNDAFNPQVGRGGYADAHSVPPGRSLSEHADRSAGCAREPVVGGEKLAVE